MSYKAFNGETWTYEKGGDWISTKYYDKMEIVSMIRKRNLIFIVTLALYLIISASLILF